MFLAFATVLTSCQVLLIRVHHGHVYTVNAQAAYSLPPSSSVIHTTQLRSEWRNVPPVAWIHIVAPLGVFHRRDGVD